MSDNAPLWAYEKEGRFFTRIDEVVDLYSYKVLEELVAPFDGYLFFSRYSGVVGGGTQAFALAEADKSTWLES